MLPARELPSDATTAHELHDLGDVSLLPGFVETHVHMHYPASLDYRDIARPEPVERLLIRATANMRRLLLSGATTARDTGSRDDVALAMRDALRDGIAPGPRLLVTGAPITTTGGHYWFLGAEADTTDEVVRRVRERKRLGVDAVKIIASGGGYTPTSNPRSQQYGPDMLRAAVGEAHRLGLPVLAHSLTTVSNRNAVDAGVDTVIHGGVWWTEFEVRDRAYDSTRGSPTRWRARARGSTRRSARSSFTTSTTPAGRPDKPEFGHWALPDVPSELEPRLGVHAGHGGARRPVHRRDGHGHADRHVRHGRVQRPGLRAAPGLRPVAPSGRSPSTPRQRSAWPATTGAIRPGLAADLVAVPGDPITDLAALRTPSDVIQAGRPVLRGEGAALV